ncbi:hypothetical protein LEMLEM_LOCUS25781 [Lemmus lemmus]
MDPTGSKSHEVLCSPPQAKRAGNAEVGQLRPRSALSGPLAASGRENVARAHGSQSERPAPPRGRARSRDSPAPPLERSCRGWRAGLVSAAWGRGRGGASGEGYIRRDSGAPPRTRALGGLGVCGAPSSRPRQGPARLSGEGSGGTGSEGPGAAGGL